jgi:hypothetical protein
MFKNKMKFNHKPEGNRPLETHKRTVHKGTPSTHTHKRTAHQRNTDGRTPKYNVKKNIIKKIIIGEYIGMLTRKVHEDGLLWPEHVARLNILIL